MTRATTKLLILISACLPTAARADILTGPYLQGVTPTGIYVLVECTSTNPATVEYGTSGAYGQTATTASIQTTGYYTYRPVHNIKLTGLQPDTLYHYRASQGTSVSADFTFRTTFTATRDFRFTVMGDCREHTNIHAQVATAIRDADPLFSVYLGDLCSGRGYDLWKDEFFIPNELALLARVPFYNTDGDHEGGGANTRAFTQPPNMDSGTERYYSFNCGNMHVLVLATGEDADRGSAQYNFAKADIENCTKKWKAVTYHDATYAAGGHGEDDDMAHLIEDVFEPQGVDVIFNADSHFYQHNLVDGIHYIVSGGGGARLYPPSTAPYTLTSTKAHHYLVVDVSADEFQMTGYDLDGLVLDTLTLTKADGPEHDDVPFGSSWRYAKGTAEASTPPTAWRDTNFDDSGWATGFAPFGYGDGPYGTELTDMRGLYSSVFLRNTFNVSQPALVRALQVDLSYDDGFILWINGQEVARVNMNGQPHDFQPFSDVAVNAVGNGTDWSTTLTGGALPTLRPGSNTVAIQIFNASLAGSSDLTLDAQLTVHFALLPETVDPDGDGLPDTWELDRLGGTGQNAGDDPDGDGLSNLQEFIAGSNPNSPTDTLRVETCLNGQQIEVRVFARTAAGPGYEGLSRHYALEQRNGLGPHTPWQTIPAFEDILGNCQTILYGRPSWAPPASFRARTWLESAP